MSLLLLPLGLTKPLVQPGVNKKALANKTSVLQSRWFGNRITREPVSYTHLDVYKRQVFRYANCFPATIQAIASGKFDVKSMVTHRYSYAQSQQAFEESVSQKRDIIKGVIQVVEPFIEGRNNNACRYSFLGG